MSKLFNILNSILFDGVALISDLFLDCELLEVDPLLREDYEISEEELRNCVKKTLLEIKEC